jgi:hypothetical protein
MKLWSVHNPTYKLEGFGGGGGGGHSHWHVRGSRTNGCWGSDWLVFHTISSSWAAVEWSHGSPYFVVTVTLEHLLCRIYYPFRSYIFWDAAHGQGQNGALFSSVLRDLDDTVQYLSWIRTLAPNIKKILIQISSKKFSGLNFMLIDMFTLSLFSCIVIRRWKWISSRLQQKENPDTVSSWSVTTL